MPTVAEIHAREANTGGWVVFAEGLAEGFTNIDELVGSGASSWIGTAYGAREIKPGLVMPSSLPFGETNPWLADIVGGQTVSFTVIDFDGSIAALFSDVPDPATTYTLGQRISPLDDPAPDPAIGLDGELVTAWGMHCGLERFGPAGERRHFWIAPDDVPPGLDHPAPIGLPPVTVSVTPTAWAGRKVAVYWIVQDPDTGEWPSWEDQYDGGSLFWYGTITDQGRWDDYSGERESGRAHTFQCHGPASWMEKSLNLARPTRWYVPEAGVALTGDELKVACWIEPVEFESLGEGIGIRRTLYDAQTLESGNDLTGLSTREEIAQKIYDIVRAMVDGATYNGVDGAATNAVWVGPGPVSEGLWNKGDPDDELRKVRISADGGVVEIKCHDGESKLGFRVGLSLDVRVWQLLGWDISSFHFAEQFPAGLPVGGVHWGEADATEVPPPYHRVGLFSTRDEQGLQGQSHWDNDGAWKKYEAQYQIGTITLDHLGGDEVFIAVGDVPTEGQHGNPFTLGSQIDGEDVDSAGWWVFRGWKLTALDYELGADPSEYIGVALCEWVATAEGDQVLQNSVGFATLRILRWEDPRRFGFPFDPLEEPWCNVIGGLECAPLGVLGGIETTTPGWRHRLIPSLMVSSGTAVWDDSGDVVTITPGVNHPGDLPADQPWPGDLEVADLGLGLPAVFVDWASWAYAAASLPGGIGGALNRVLYPLFGSFKASKLLRECMAGAGWGWSLARPAGGKVPAFGAYDPLKPLSPADSVMSLTRDKMAEPTVTPGEPQWRGKLDLRRGGPYDRFTVSAGRNPIDGGADPYVRSWESQDSERRGRSGRIEWEVFDGGIRDPGPWLGTGAQQLYDWTGLGRQRFPAGFGPRLAGQLRIYKADYQQNIANLVGLGSVVRVVDATAEAADGTRSIDHMGRVISAEILTRGAGNGILRLAIELERYPVSAVHTWGPYAYSARGGWDSGSSTATIAADVALVGDDHADTTGWTRPTWVTAAAGNMAVTIYQSEDGETFDAGLTATAKIRGVNPGVSTIEFQNIVGTVYRDTVKLIVPSGLDDVLQTAAWVLALFAPITTPGGTWDGGTVGVRLK